MDTYMRNIVWSLSIRKTSSQNIDVQDRIQWAIDNISFCIWTFEMLNLHQMVKY